MFPFLGAAARSTRRIGLGTAIVTLPLEGPIRVAEDAAFVDIISGGRLQFGLGPGGDPLTFSALGRDLDSRREAHARGAFPPGLSAEEAFASTHIHYGHPEEVIASLRADRLLPMTTELICQVQPGSPTQSQILKSLELIATQVAPELGWRPKLPTAAEGV